MLLISKIGVLGGARTFYFHKLVLRARCGGIRRQRQGDLCDSQASQGYTVRHCLKVINKNLTLPWNFIPQFV